MTSRSEEKRLSAMGAPWATSSSGFGASYHAPVVFDIETSGITDAGDYVEMPVAPANYKDPEKIAVYIEEKFAENVQRAALDPDLARVVCLCAQSGNELLSIVAKDEEDERVLLTEFWKYVGAGPDQAQLVGFGILGYDLRVLLRRSLYLDVTAPPLLIDRYRHQGVIDLMDELSFHGQEKYHSLEFYVKRFKLGPFPDDIKGSTVPALVAVGAWPEVLRHCEIDLAKTVALARRTGVLR
jgi:predicted PolB exonuclease-like 3'-5' exonuclease